MDATRETTKETLLSGAEDPLDSFDALVERCHRALSAALWMTCCWGSSANIGDFRFLVVEVEPDPETSLYVQFWSEPGEDVLMEVGSGEWCPGAIRYIGTPERRALEERGYTIGGEAQNYCRNLVIDSAAEAEAAALDTLRIFFDVLKYRGQWPLEVERHQGERAEHDLVYSSVTPEDLARVATNAGFSVVRSDLEDAPAFLLTRGRRSFLASLDWRRRDHNLYALVSLRAQLNLKRTMTDDALAELNAVMRFVKLSRLGPRALSMQMSIVLAGGVTVGWMAKSLEHWIGSWRECERQLRRGVSKKRHMKVRALQVVH